MNKPQVHTFFGVVLLFLSACAAAPTPVQPPLPPGVRATPTSLAQAPTWRTASQSITLENINQISLLGRLEAPQPPSTIFDYALSPDNTRLAVLNNDLVVAWDLVTGRLVFSTSRGDATRIFYSPGKDEIYTLTDSGEVNILNSEDGTYEETLNAQPEYVGTADYFADESWLALVAANGDIKVWNILERLSLVTLTGEGSTPVNLRFSPDGTRLAVAYADGGVHLWDWQARQVVLTLTPLPPEQSTLIERLRFSGDGSKLAGLGSSFGVTWDVVTGDLLNIIPIGRGGGSYLFESAPVGDLLVSGGTTADAGLWNLQDGEQIISLAEFGGGENVDADFSPDGNFLFTTLLYGDLALWNLTDAEEGNVGRAGLTFENRNILNVEWTEDGFLILMFDARGPVDVWGIP